MVKGKSAEHRVGVEEIVALLFEKRCDIKGDGAHAVFGLTRDEWQKRRHNRKWNS